MVLRHAPDEERALAQELGVALLRRARADAQLLHSLRDFDRASCDAAIALGADVCNELTRQMPFVSWCGQEGQWHDEGCSVRIHVGFAEHVPEMGVFSTALPGLLAFTID